MSSLLNLLVLALAAVGSVSAIPLEPTSPPAPAPTTDTKSLFEDLYTSPTQLGRFQRLLVDPATGDLLKGDALKKAISFDYNNAAGDKAGKISAAVAATFPFLVGQDISTVAAFLGPCR
jgi:hypothetical protein